MECMHVNLPELRLPAPNQAVYREDCTQCFDSIDDPTGLDVCLYCFNGGCTAERNHAALHSTLHDHPLALNIRRIKKHIVRDEPPQKISKLSIAAESESDRYDLQTSVRCYKCSIDEVDKSAGKLPQMIDGVLKANTFSKDAEIQAWELEIETCDHLLELEPIGKRQIESQDLGHCSSCDLKENLWLCLDCGALGCGRAQFGGSKGNSHALAHAKTNNHQVAVKLGSITPEGTADVYCYLCDEERIDHELGTHLAHWGIMLADRQKTEKSLVEQQVEQNMKWEFSMTDERGNELQPVFGKGLTGLKNIGNSCYLASIFQCLFSLPQFQKRYYGWDDDAADLPLVAEPAQDLETQLRKLADGLLSGRYSRPDTHANASEHPGEVRFQRGIAPSMLKHLVGKGHPEFSTMRQQDAFEFLQHIMKLITRAPQRGGLENPVQSFRFVTEQKLKCSSCDRVRYQTDEQDNISVPVPMRKIPRAAAAEGEDAEKDAYEPITLEECLDNFTAPELVELTCPACGSKDGFYKQTLFQTFPDVLAVNARRFHFINWVPVKLDIPVVVGDEPFSMDKYQSPARPDTEKLLPGDPYTPAFIPNEDALCMLQSMGFPRNHCDRGLYATGNSDANAAIEWLIAHMEDPDLNEPLLLNAAASSSSAAIDPLSVEHLTAMGFSTPQARKALRETGGEIERAVEWVFSHPDDQGDFGEEAPPPVPDVQKVVGRGGPAQFQLDSIVCHKGGSVHVGHYVAFVRKQLDESEKAWVLFNDEKVVRASDVEEMKKFAYVYFFRRQ